jgi:hypothetical protein
VHANPGHAAQGLAFDLDHDVRDFLDHFALLSRAEHAFNELNVDQWHWQSFRVTPHAAACSGAFEARVQISPVHDLNRGDIESELVS